MPFRANLAKLLEQAAQAQQPNPATRQQQQFTANDFWANFQQGYNNVHQGRSALDDGNTSVSTQSQPLQSSSSYRESTGYMPSIAQVVPQSYIPAPALIADPALAAQLNWNSTNYSDFGVTLDVPAISTITSDPPLRTIAISGQEIFIGLQPVYSQKTAQEYHSRHQGDFTYTSGLKFTLVSPPRLLTGTKAGITGYISTHRCICTDNSYLATYNILLTNTTYDHAILLTASSNTSDSAKALAYAQRIAQSLTFIPRPSNGDAVLIGRYSGTNSDRSPGYYSSASVYTQYELQLLGSGIYHLDKTFSGFVSAGLHSMSNRNTERETGTWTSIGSERQGKVVLTDTQQMFLECPYWNDSSDPAYRRMFVRLGGKTALRWRGDVAVWERVDDD